MNRMSNTKKKPAKPKIGLPVIIFGLFIAASMISVVCMLWPKAPADVPETITCVHDDGCFFKCEGSSCSHVCSVYCKLEAGSSDHTDISEISMRFSARSTVFTAGNYGYVSLLNPPDQVVWEASNDNIRLFDRATGEPLTFGEPCSVFNIMVSADETGSGRIIAVSANGSETAECKADILAGFGAVSSLYISAGDLSPYFSPDVFSYELHLPSDEESVFISVEKVAGSAVKINDMPSSSARVSLEIGETTDVKISVLENGAYISYNLKVTRDASSDTTLKNLRITNAFGFDFDPSIHSYIVEAANSEKAFKIEADANDKSARIFINGVETGNTELKLSADTDQMLIKVESANGDRADYILTFITEESHVPHGSGDYTVFLSPSRQEDNVGVIDDYGTEAYRMNLIADAVQKYLERYGVAVFRSSDERTISDVAASSLSCGADLHVALHSNAYDGSIRGCEVWAYSRGDPSEALGQNILESIMQVYNGPDRGLKICREHKIYLDELYAMEKAGVPAVLIEIAYHDNSKDAQFIIDHTSELGEQVAKGILKQLGII